MTARRSASGPFLVLGATGLLGARLRDLLRERHGSDAVRAVSRTGAPGGGVDALDLRDADATRRYVSRLSPAAVVWCVRAGASDAGGGEPALARAGLRSVCAALGRSTRVLYVSSDSVLAGERGPHDEATPTAALPAPSPYARYVTGKMLGEETVAALGARGLVVRCGPIFGRDASGAWDARTAALLDAWQRGESVRRPLDILRSWIHVGDLAAALAALVERPATGLMHVGPLEGASLYDHAFWVARALGPPGARLAPAHVVPSDARRRAVRRDLRLDARRSHALLGRVPQALPDALAVERVAARGAHASRV